MAKKKGQAVDVSVHPTTGAVIIRPGVKYYEDGEVTDTFLAVAEGVRAWNPVFDVTPADLIDAIVTERGVVERPNRDSMRAMFG